VRLNICVGRTDIRFTEVKQCRVHNFSEYTDILKKYLTVMA